MNTLLLLLVDLLVLLWSAESFQNRYAHIALREPFGYLRLRSRCIPKRSMTVSVIPHQLSGDIQQKVSPEANLNDVLVALRRELPDSQETMSQKVNARSSTRSIVPFIEARKAIRSAGRLGRAEDAIEIFEHLPVLGYPQDTMSYNNLIWALGNCHREDLALHYFDQLRNQTTISPNMFSYEALMHTYTCSANYAAALSLLQQMPETPNVVVFTSAIKACAAANKSREAASVLFFAEQIGAQPDVTMYTCALKACCQSGAMKRVDQILDKMRQYSLMDTWTFHTVMMGHFRLQHYSTVLALFYEALDTPNVEIGEGFYTLALTAALRSDQYGEGVQISQLAETAGVKLTVQGYNILMQCYQRLGQYAEAIRCLDRIEAGGIRPTVFNYATAIDASQHNPEEALQIYRRMLKHQQEQQIQLQQQEHSGELIEPNVVLLTSLINSLARHGGEYLATAEALLSSMKSSGPAPNVFTYNAMIGGYSRLRMRKAALALVEQMAVHLQEDPLSVAPNSVTFTQLLLATESAHGYDYPNPDLADQAEYILYSLIPKFPDFRPDSKVYVAVLKCLCKAGQGSRAIRCLKEMVAQKISPSSFHYNLALQALKLEGKVDAMHRMVWALVRNKHTRHRLNYKSFALLVPALLKAKKYEYAFDMVKEMDQCRFTPPRPVCERLILELDSMGESRSALTVFQIMLRHGFEFFKVPWLNGVFNRLVKSMGNEVKTSSPVVPAQPPIDESSISAYM